MRKLERDSSNSDLGGDCNRIRRRTIGSAYRNEEVGDGSMEAQKEGPDFNDGGVGGYGTHTEDGGR